MNKYKKKNNEAVVHPEEEEKEEDLPQINKEEPDRGSIWCTEKIFGKKTTDEFETPRSCFKWMFDLTNSFGDWLKRSIFNICFSDAAMKLLSQIVLALSDVDVITTFMSYETYVKEGSWLVFIGNIVMWIVYCGGAFFASQHEKSFMAHMQKKMEQGAFQHVDEHVKELALLPFEIWRSKEVGMESDNEEEKKNNKIEGTYSTYNGELEVQYLLPPKLKRDKTDMFNVAQAKQHLKLKAQEKDYEKQQKQILQQHVTSKEEMEKRDNEVQALKPKINQDEQAVLRKIFPTDFFMDRKAKEEELKKKQTKEDKNNDKRTLLSQLRALCKSKVVRKPGLRYSDLAEYQSQFIEIFFDMTKQNVEDRPKRGDAKAKKDEWEDVRREGINKYKGQLPAITEAEIINMYIEEHFTDRQSIKGIFSQSNAIAQYYDEWTIFARNSIEWKQSIPLYRLMMYGYRSSIEPTEFSGILNANALYSFSVGLVQLAYTTALLFRGLLTDELVRIAWAVSTASFFVSICNLVLNFPRLLSQKESEMQKKEADAKRIDRQIQEFRKQLTDVQLRESRILVRELQKVTQTQKNPEQQNKPRDDDAAVKAFQKYSALTSRLNMNLEREVMRKRAMLDIQSSMKKQPYSLDRAITYSEDSRNFASKSRSSVETKRFRKRQRQHWNRADMNVYKADEQWIELQKHPSWIAANTSDSATLPSLGPLA